MEAIRVLFKPEVEDLISIFGGYFILMIPAGIYLMVHRLRHGGNNE